MVVSCVRHMRTEMNSQFMQSDEEWKKRHRKKERISTQPTEGFKPMINDRFAGLLLTQRGGIGYCPREIESKVVRRSKER